MVATPRPSGPTLRAKAPIFDLGRGVRAVAQLVLQTHDPEAGVAPAVRRPSRNQEAGQPAFGVGQRQEGVRHRRGAEPLVPRQPIPARLVHRIGSRGVRAHVRAALFLGHGHADRDAGLVRRRRNGGIVPPRQHARRPLGRDGGLRRQRRNRRIGHGHGTGRARVGLRRQEQDGGVGDLARRSPVPGDRGEAAVEPQGQQPMIGGMKANLVDSSAVVVEAFQRRRLAIGLGAPADHLGRSAARAQRRQSLDVAAAPGAYDRVRQPAVAREQVHVLQRRRLVDDLVGVEAGDWTKGGHGGSTRRKSSR